MSRPVSRSSSTNALSLSSARTVNRRPPRAYTSAVKITRPVESISDEQPQLNPALLKFSAMASQHHIRCYGFTASIVAETK